MSGSSHSSLDAEPGFAEAHFNLGHLALSAGQHAEAVAHFERAILGDPEFPNPLYNLAALYIISSPIVSSRQPSFLLRAPRGIPVL
jgi:tetratricopeptide (TPR) repeat protein